jgi:hypothetical protein
MGENGGKARIRMRLLGAILLCTSHRMERHTSRANRRPFGFSASYSYSLQQQFAYNAVIAHKSTTIENTVSRNLRVYTFV